MITDTYFVLEDIAEERQRQDTKWGPQSYPIGLWGAAAALHATKQKELVDQAAKDGTLTWADIFHEEWFEALTEDDPAMARVELVQAAAVLVACIEDIDRKEYEDE